RRVHAGGAGARRDRRRRVTLSRAAGVTIRQATLADLPDAHRIWRDAIDAYTERLGAQPMPRENPGVMRLHAHCIATDPTRFQVAVRSSIRGEGRVVGFGSAVDRGQLWFLSMLFVEPGEQARGLGKALLGALLPEDLDGRVLATCTDAAQPISNGLYSTLAITPRGSQAVSSQTSTRHCSGSRTRRTTPSSRPSHGTRSRCAPTTGACSA